MRIIVEDAINASNLTYKERLQLLKDNNPDEYSRLWRNNYSGPVWERLMDDAKVRTERKTKSKPYIEGQICGRKDTLSGFASNTSKAVYSLTSCRTGHNPEFNPEPGVMEHPMLHKRYMHKSRIEYMSYIRPDTETMNQTLRMHGTYDTDKVHADKAGIQIAPLCPAAPGKFFHADVRISDQAIMTAQRAQESLARSLGQRRSQRPQSAHPMMQSARIQAAKQQGSQGTPPAARPIPSQQQPQQQVEERLDGQAGHTTLSIHKPMQLAQRPQSARVSSHSSSSQSSISLKSMAGALTPRQSENITNLVPKSRLITDGHTLQQNASDTQRKVVWDV